MDVRQLRYFLTVARCRSFSRAANELNVAQPALSHHVANLEAELGVKLFERSTKGVLPTECGETLIRHAEIIVRQVAKAAVDVKITSAQPSGTVSIGLPTSISLSLIVPLLKEVEARHPLITLKIIENHSGFLAELVLAGRLDMAILFDVDAASSFDLQPLLQEQLYFVTASEDLVKDKSAIELKDISGYPLILTSANHGLRHAIDRCADNVSCEINVKSEIDSLVAIKQLVASGYGHSILPWCAIQEECLSGAVHASRIENPLIERRLYLASAKEWPRSRAADITSMLLSDVARRLVAEDRWRGTLLGQKSAGVRQAPKGA